MFSIPPSQKKKIFYGPAPAHRHSTHVAEELLTLDRLLESWSR